MASKEAMQCTTSKTANTYTHTHTQITRHVKYISYMYPCMRIVSVSFTAHSSTLYLYFQAKKQIWKYSAPHPKAQSAKQCRSKYCYNNLEMCVHVLHFNLFCWCWLSVCSGRRSSGEAHVMTNIQNESWWGMGRRRAPTKHIKITNRNKKERAYNNGSSSSNNNELRINSTNRRTKKAV